MFHGGHLWEPKEKLDFEFCFTASSYPNQWQKDISSSLALVLSLRLSSALTCSSGGEELPSLCLFLLQVGKMLHVPGNWDFVAPVSQAAAPACSALCSPAVLFSQSTWGDRAHSCHCLTLKHFGFIGIKLFVWVSERGKQSRYLACGGKGILLMKAAFLLL